jgi:hypothetical protein
MIIDYNSPISAIEEVCSVYWDVSTTKEKNSNIHNKVYLFNIVPEESAEDAEYEDFEDGNICILNWPLIEQCAEFPLINILDTNSSDWDIKSNYRRTSFFKTLCLALLNARNTGFACNADYEVKKEEFSLYQQKAKEEPVYEVDVSEEIADDNISMLWGEDYSLLESDHYDKNTGKRVVSKLMIATIISWPGVFYHLTHANTSERTELSEYAVAKALYQAYKLGLEEGKR